MPENTATELLDTSIWEHRCPDGVGGCTAISNTYLAALLEFIAAVGETRYWRSEAAIFLRAAHDDGYRVHEDGYLETPR